MGETSSQSIDDKRRHQVAYEYLCHLEEAKLWMEHNLHIELPPSTDLEEYLRNGIVLAILGNFFAPKSVPVKRIYDIDFLQFQVFYPETTDIYDMKNMPKLIYCLHALSMFLAKMGLATPIQNLLGVVQFDEADIIKMSKALEAYGVQMPAFSKIGGILASELSENDAALHAAIILINEALENNDKILFNERITSSPAQLFNLDSKLFDEYFTQLLKNKRKKCEKCDSIGKAAEDEDVYDRNLTQTEIQTIITDINIKKLMIEITLAARAKDSQKLIDCLVSRDLAAPNVKFDNGDLYTEVFSNFLDEQDSHSHASRDSRSSRTLIDDSNSLYTFNKNDVFKLISSGNLMADTRNRIYNFIQKLNENLDNLTAETLCNLVDEFKVDIGEFTKENSESYLQVMRFSSKNAQGENESLWFDKVKKIISRTNDLIQSNLEMIKTIEKLNNALMGEQTSSTADTVYSLLEQSDIKGLSDKCKNEYVADLHKKLKSRNFHDWDGFCLHKVKDSSAVFNFNHKTREFDLSPFLDSSYGSQLFSISVEDADGSKKHEIRESFQKLNLSGSGLPEYGYMNYFDFHSSIRDVTQQYNREMYILANVDYVKIIQSFYRTLVLHMKFVKLPHIKMIQGLTRSLIILSNLRRVNEKNTGYRKEICLLQDFFRTFIVLNPYQRRIGYFKQHKEKIVALQSIIRACQAHADYNNLVHNENPSCKAVSKFVRLLEFDATDLKEEKEIADLKQSVLDRIREVNELEDEIKDMDVRIGLLVKNRLQVQDVIGHNQAKKKKSRKMFLPTVTKEKQELIEKYGQLLYILQTNPSYTSQLILTFTGNRSSSFIKETCYALYNYGTNIRDEYTIINMFAKALELEILTKIDTIQEFTRGDPLVIRMVIVFWRNSKAQTWIEEILKSCVKDVLNNKYSINTNPVEIYKQWIAQLETESGQKTGKPYDVDVETALTYEEVNIRLKQNIKTLIEICEKFVNSIISNTDKIPYGLRFIAKTLYKMLEKRFPEATDTDYLKVVGNLLYYRLINPGITAPDDFKIAATAEINMEKRKNLAFIASILQKSAAKNFSFDAKATNIDVNSLDYYMNQTWNKFSTWYIKCIDVEELAIHFNMDEYTDQTTIHRPNLSLKVGQILEVHKLILSMDDDMYISPKTNDPLYKVLKMFGDEMPQAVDLVGMNAMAGQKSPDSPSTSENSANESMLNIIINFPLISPTVDNDNEETTRKQLFLETMQYVIDLMYFEPGDNLGRILQKKFSQDHEKSFIELQKNRNQIAGDLKNVNEEKSKKQIKSGTSVDKSDGKDNSNDKTAPSSKLTDTTKSGDVDTSAKNAMSLTSSKSINPNEIPVISLEETKKRVLENAKKLEEYGMCSSKNDYQSLVVAIAKEIRNRRQYRKHRRFDLLRLRSALDNLDSKNNYLLLQLDSYNMYVKACVQNMQLKGKKAGKSNSATGIKRTTIKYSAAKLHSLGVILEIEGLSESQFKNVLFEISSTDDPGVFSVSAKLFGVNMEKLELVLHDLLQLQYENVTVMKLFDRAKVNVNLLIFTINKKFFIKKK